MDRFSIKALIRAALIAATLLIFIPEMTAQSYVQAPVTISKEKVKIDGKVCYSHIVLERQTLYSISKAYNVSIEDIYRFNPALKETGLKKNGIILIPSAEALEGKTADEQKKAEEEAAVKRQEALDSLTKADETVRKPESKKVKRKTHTVKWFEDLDVIAEKYGVTTEALMKLNNLESRKLTSRQKLLIPTPEDMETYVAEEAAAAADETPEVAELPDSTSAEVPAEQEETVSIEYRDVTAGLLMPLKANGTTSHKGNMDFYSGVLLAISDLSEKGIGTNLKVFDIAGNGIPPHSYLSDCDFVIGPVAPADLTKALEETAGDGPAFISPLDQRAQSLASSYAGLIQAPTPYSVQYRDLINWLREDVKGSDKVIFITEKGARQTEVLTQMQSAIDSSGIAYRNFSYSILEGRDIMDPLMALMTPLGSNRVVIASESEAFVNDVVRNLNLIEYQKYDVVLYAPAKVRNFETIDVENIHNTSLHASLAYYINYDKDQVKSFLMKYRALFNTEPTQFAFQGYDLAYYFISMASRYGDKWMDMLENDEQEMLQSTFRFRRNADGGFINKGVRRIIYEEGWLVKEID